MSREASAELTVREAGQSYTKVADKVSDIVLKRPGQLSWLMAFVITGGLVFVLAYSIGYLFWKGVGIWAIDIPVAWGFAILNYVFWIAIAMSGTFISAALLLSRQHWRTSINRFAETMTVLAIANAGLFPLLHLGSPWIFFYLFPYPNRMELWPQFRSPLIWDVFAVTIYFFASLAFWYVGMLPDLALLRDRAKGKLGKAFYGLLAAGWRGGSRTWKRQQTTYLLLAALGLPLVISVHSVTAADFAAALPRWWHETVFPPYFVGGAIFSGFAMALIIAIPLRAIYGLHDYITLKHIDNCGKLMLLAGLVVTWGYISEIWSSWYSGSVYDWYQTWNYAAGPIAWCFWLAIACNVGITQLLWFPKVRRNVPLMFFLAVLIQLGMWTERYMIVVPVLSRTTSCPAPGAPTTRRSSTGPPSSERSDCSASASSSSCGFSRS